MNTARRRFLGLSAATAAGLALNPSWVFAAQRHSAKTVTLRSGRQVPALGMGSWHLGQGRHPAKQEVAALRTGIENNMTLIDTAEMYSGGNAEKLIGRAIRGRRDKVFLVSKILPSHATADGIPKACRASLDRLGVDHLDLYLLHWRGGADLGEVVSGFEQLKSDGLIRAWGVSNFGIGDMRDLWQVSNGQNCAANQMPYSLKDRDIESGLMPWCRDHEVAIMAYSPLGNSDLIGNETLARIGKRHDVTGPAIALAWAIRGDNVIAIPESGTPAHIRGDAKALSVSLTDADIHELNQAFPA